MGFIAAVLTASRVDPECSPAEIQWFWSLAFLAACYTIWRLWTFHLVPLVYPNEPLAYPYLIPGLGHAIPFVRNSCQVFEDASKYFGPTRPIYSLVVAGRSMYILTGTQDAQELYRNAKSLSWESFVKDLFTRIGYPKASHETLWKPPTPKQQAADPGRDRAPVHMTEKYMRQQLLPGEKLLVMTSKVAQHLQRSLAWATLSNQSFVTDRSQNSIEVDLFAWTTQTFIIGLGEAFWGKKIFDINPNLIRHFLNWEDLAWKSIFQFPGSVSGDMRSARDRLISTFQQYFELDKSEREETNWWVPTAEAEFRGAGLDSSDLGRGHMLSLWAINANLHKMAFWMLTQIIHDPDLRRKIEEELRLAYSEGGLQLDVFEKGYPVLDAVWHEVLRLRVTTSLARKAEQDTKIGTKIIKKGSHIVVPFRVLHYDETVWGKSPKQFDKTRFLNRPGLVKHANYRPFGGGAHLCPGRFIAKQLVYAFLAITLCDLRPSLNTAKGCGNNLPRPKEDTVVLGTLPPLPDDRVFLTLFNGDSFKSMA